MDGSLAGEACWERIAGIERFARRSCALVVVGSVLRPSRDDLLLSPLRLGVVGIAGVEVGATGAGMLETEFCVE